MAPLRTWVRLLVENGGVAPRYWGKLGRALLLTTLVSPLRVAERLRYGRHVAQTALDRPAALYLGICPGAAPRICTTSCNRTRGTGRFRLFSRLCRPFFLIGRGWLKRRMAKSLPATRPMDNVRLSLDAPVEEEVAISNTCSLSPIHHLSFPRRARTYLDKYLTMQGLTKEELARWDRVYLDVLRKATFDSVGGGGGG